MHPTDGATPYGLELALDIHECDNIPCDRAFIERFLAELCELIDMERADLHFWDYDGYPDDYAEAPDHLKGISAVQFIMTSTVVIHTIDVPKTVYLNIFSCKTFDSQAVGVFCAKFFGGTVVNSHTMDRL